MKVLVACEYSGAVRDAFIRAGHDAMSCDLEPTEKPGPHYHGPVQDVLYAGWDLLVGHPPCTFMANSGAKHLYKGMKKENGPDPLRWENMREAAKFFLLLWNAPIPRIALENPVMVGHAQKIIGVSPSQTIQPWQFGHMEVKRTCLWLKNLPPLQETNNVYEEMMKLPYGERAKVHYASPGPMRWKERSRTYLGIAGAMAEQWGNPTT